MGRIPILQDEESSGDGCCWWLTAMQMNVLLFNSTLKNGYDGKVHVPCILL